MTLRLALVSVFAVSTFCSLPSKAQEMNLQPIPSITVTGEGEISVRPDAVYITLGVESAGKDAGEALTENNTAMQRLMDTLERNDIEKKNIQTSNFNISPRYDNSRPPRGEAAQQPKIVGYSVSNRVRVKSTKIDQLGSLLDALVREGANSMYGIEFGVSDPKAAKDKAARAAVADAKRKAELLAEAAGVRLGSPIKISEASHDGPRPMMMEARMMMADSSVPVSEGEQQIKATITVTYKLIAGE